LQHSKIETEAALERLRSENDALEKELEDINAQALLLNQFNSETLRHIVDQENQIQQIPEKKQQIQLQAAQSKIEQKHFEEGLCDELRRNEKQMGPKSRLEADQQRLQREVESLRTEARNLKNNADASHRKDLKSQSEKLSSLLKKNEQIADTKERKVRNFEVQLRAKEKNVAELREECTRVKNDLKQRLAAREARLKAEAKRNEAQTNTMIIKDNKYIAEVLKEKLQKREKAAGKLKGKLSQVAVLESKMELRERMFDGERHRFENELDYCRLNTAENTEVDEEASDDTCSFAPESPRSPSDTEPRWSIEEARFESRQSRKLSRRSSDTSQLPKQQLRQADVDGSPVLRHPRPSSAVTGRQLPASQTWTCTGPLVCSPVSRTKSVGQVSY